MMRRSDHAAGSTAAPWLAALLLAVSCAPDSPSPDTSPCRSAVLITIDTFRADAFGAGGHPRVRTPHIDRFFRRGVQFAEAYSPCATTLASHTSLMTGAWPTSHGVLRNRSLVPRELVTLAEILNGRGIATAALVSSAVLDPRLGLDQGFEVYDFQPTRTVKLDAPWRPAGRTLRRALAWWRGSAERRRFLWVHLFEPHFPYEPLPELARLYDPGYAGDLRPDMYALVKIWEDADGTPAEDIRHLRALYQAEITGLDGKLGAFLREIEEDATTAVILTADHGESLGEHDLFFKHGPHVYPADVRVPLGLRAKDVPPAIVPYLVRTIDVPGTFLSLLGVHAELPEEAANLLDRIGASSGLPVFALASMPWVDTPGKERAKLQRAVRTAGISYVETPWRSEAQWFDRRTDPDELAGREAAEAGFPENLPSALAAWVEGEAAPAADLTDAELLKQLESLGYVR